jgi:hypothetical protein
MAYSKTIITFSIVLSSIAALAQKVVISAELNKDRIFIGEQIEWTFQGVINKTQNIPWTLPDSLPHFEVLDKSKIDSQVSGEDIILKQVLTLTSWDSGSWQLPPVSIAGSNKTKPIKVDVGYSPFDPSQDYHDVKDIMDVVKPFKENWYWYLVGAILLLLIFLLLFPKKKKPTQVGFVPDAGIYKSSLARLEKLRKNIDTEPKAFYTELTSIFRDYLQKRKGIQSYSKTTDDLGLQLGKLQMEKTTYQSLLQTLRLSDLVKFARYHPPVSEQEQALEVIKQNIIAIESNK